MSWNKNNPQPFAISYVNRLDSIVIQPHKVVDGIDFGTVAFPTKSSLKVLDM